MKLNMSQAVALSAILAASTPLTRAEGSVYAIEAPTQASAMVASADAGKIFTREEFADLLLNRDRSPLKRTNIHPGQSPVVAFVLNEKGRPQCMACLPGAGKAKSALRICPLNGNTIIEEGTFIILKK